MPGSLISQTVCTCEGYSDGMASPESSTEKKRGRPLLDLAIGIGAVAIGLSLAQHIVLEGALYLHHHLR